MALASARPASWEPDGPSWPILTLRSSTQTDCFLTKDGPGSRNQFGSNNASRLPGERFEPFCRFQISLSFARRRGAMRQRSPPKGRAAILGAVHQSNDQRVVCKSIGSLFIELPAPLCFFLRSDLPQLRNVMNYNFSVAGFCRPNRCEVAQNAINRLARRTDH